MELNFFNVLLAIYKLFIIFLLLKIEWYSFNH